MLIRQCTPTGRARCNTVPDSRELEVLRMVAKGLGNKAIAASLSIAEVTVKLHVSHVLEKLNVKDRTEAATIALQRGIIRMD